MSPEDIKDAGEWAELLFTPEKIALLLEIPAEQVLIALATPGDALGMSIQKGYLLAEAELRRAALDWAKRGSTPALQMAVNWLNQVPR